MEGDGKDQGRACRAKTDRQRHRRQKEIKAAHYLAPEERERSSLQALKSISEFDQTPSRVDRPVVVPVHDLPQRYTEHRVSLSGPFVPSHSHSFRN